MKTKDRNYTYIYPAMKTEFNKPPTEIDSECFYIFGEHYSLTEAIEDLIESEPDIDPDENGSFYFWVKEFGRLTWMFVEVSIESEIKLRIVPSSIQSQFKHSITNYHLNVDNNNLKNILEYFGIK